MKIVFLMTHIPDPRMYKRIDMLHPLGEISVICVRRKSQDIYTLRRDNIAHYVYHIDLPSSGKVFKRFMLSCGFQKAAVKRLNELEPHWIYADGFDALMAACRYQKKKPETSIAYEVADIREVFLSKPRNIVKKIYRQALGYMEARCFLKLSLLALTSMAFYDEYYKAFIDSSKVVYLPNMPDLKDFESYRQKHEGAFTIGFIGGIRYIDQMKMLVDAAETADCRVLLAGGGGTEEDYREIESYCANRTGISFMGKYDYQRDIAGLYGMVDCVYAVYDVGNPNVRIALPNKLYESIYCQLPIIVAKDTYLAKVVEENGVGMAVSHKNPKELVQALQTLKSSHETYECIRVNCEGLKETINNDAYAEKLRNSIKGMRA